MSEANDISPVSEANDVSPVSDVNETGPVSQANEVSPESAPNETGLAGEPFIRVLRGEPTDDEIAALVAVFSGAAGGVGGALGAGSGAPVTRDLWGHPVDKLRTSVYSWQNVTLLERTHVRR